MGRDALAERVSDRDRLLSSIVESLRSDVHCAGAWLLGSLSRGSADALSDIDLFVVHELDGQAMRDSVHRFGNVLHVHENPRFAPPEGAYIQIVYDGEPWPQEVDVTWCLASSAVVPTDARKLFGDRATPCPDAQRTYSELLIQWQQDREASGWKEAPWKPDRREDIQDRATAFWIVMGREVIAIARGIGTSEIEDMHALLDGIRRLLGFELDEPRRNARSLSGRVRVVDDLVAQMDELMPDIAREGASPDAFRVTGGKRMLRCVHALVESGLALPR